MYQNPNLLELKLLPSLKTRKKNKRLESSYVKLSDIRNVTSVKFLGNRAENTKSEMATLTPCKPKKY